jgi:hypothetical protein
MFLPLFTKVTMENTRLFILSGAAKRIFKPFATILRSNSILLVFERSLRLSP